MARGMSARVPSNAQSNVCSLRRAKPLMGTFVAVTLRGSDSEFLEAVAQRVFVEIARLEALLSEWRSDSAISEVNQNAGVRPVHVPVEVFDVLEIALRVSALTDGAFDPTWAALKRLWRFDEPDFSMPPANEVASFRGLVDYRNIVLDREDRTAYLVRQGMRLGLGGVAKGYIAERAADLAVHLGISNVLVDAGGDVVSRGSNGNQPWSVAVRDPRARGAILGITELADGESIATSGDYEAYIETDSGRMHHLLDPRSGYPAKGLCSVTVKGQNAAFVDALCTGLFVLGWERGFHISDALAGYKVLMLTEDGNVYSTLRTTRELSHVS